MDLLRGEGLWVETPQKRNLFLLKKLKAHQNMPKSMETFRNKKNEILSHCISVHSFWRTK